MVCAQNKGNPSLMSIYEWDKTISYEKYSVFNVFFYYFFIYFFIKIYRL